MSKSLDIAVAEVKALEEADRRTRLRSEKRVEFMRELLGGFHQSRQLFDRVEVEHFIDLAYVAGEQACLSEIQQRRWSSEQNTEVKTK